MTNPKVIISRNELLSIYGQQLHCFCLLDYYFTAFADCYLSCPFNVFYLYVFVSQHEVPNLLSDPCSQK